jgi:hypothetical protein
MNKRRHGNEKPKPPARVDRRPSVSELNAYQELRVIGDKLAAMMKDSIFGDERDLAARWFETVEKFKRAEACYRYQQISLTSAAAKRKTK